MCRPRTFSTIRRVSNASITPPPPDIPADEPAAARALRRLDEGIGVVEGAVVIFSIAMLVVVAAYDVVVAKVFDQHPTWPSEVVRYAVLFVAMAGAALASQRQGMFNMDLVTRRLTQRTRSGLRIAIGFLAVFLCGLVVQQALDLRLRSFDTTEDHEVFSVAHGYVAVVLGFGLVGLHFLLHALTEACYLAAGKLPPEPPHGGH